MPQSLYVRFLFCRKFVCFLSLIAGHRPPAHCHSHFSLSAGGDIHGQFYDLCELFKVGGDCPKVRFINLVNPSPHQRISHSHIYTHTRTDPIPVSRRLCRSRVLQRRNLPPLTSSQSTVPRSHHPHPRQPRISPNHPSLRLLRRMPSQVRIRLCLEILHRSLRLRSIRGVDRQSSLLCAWRSLPLHLHPGSNPSD